MQIKYTLFLSFLFLVPIVVSSIAVQQDNGKVIKITNKSMSDYTLSAHEPAGKKTTSPIVAQNHWSGKLTFEAPIHLTSHDKKRVFIIKAVPAYLDITTYEKVNTKNQPQKREDLRINIEQIVNNLPALIRRVTSEKITPRHSTSPWSLQLAIDEHEQISVKSIVFDETNQDGVVLKAIEIPGSVLRSYIIRIKQ